MIFIILSAMFIASGSRAQLGENSCDKSELNKCVELPVRAPVGLPKNVEELDNLCQAYNTGMSCMDTWMKRCLPTDGQKLVYQQIGGAKAIMRLLCSNETAVRREFLKEPVCWARISPDWSRCVEELKEAVKEITERAQLLAYFNKNVELCCAREAFLSCVVHASRTCSIQASTLIRRMAFLLAQDVAACAHPRAHCTASPPPFTTPFLTALSTVILYPPRF